MPQVCFSLITSRAVCYRMINWKNGLELLNEKPLNFLRKSGAGSLLEVR